MSRADKKCGFLLDNLWNDLSISTFETIAHDLVLTASFFFSTTKAAPQYHERTGRLITQ